MPNISNRRNAAKKSLPGRPPVKQAVCSAVENLEGRRLLSAVTYTVQGNSDLSADSVTKTGTNQYSANTLRAAIDSANSQLSPAVIKFNSANFPGGSANVITLTSGMSLTGAPSYQIVGLTTHPITIDGSSTYTDLAIASGTSAEIDHLMIVNGVATVAGSDSSNDGGGITSTSPLTLIGDTFTNNTANSGSGGAVYDSAGVLTVTNCTFMSNSAASGGGIFVENDTAGGTTNVTGTTFTSNSATDNGGAIVNYATADDTLTVSISTFNNNSTSDSTNTANNEGGGAIYNIATSGTLTASISSSRFTSNTSASNAGAILSSGTTLTLTSDTFTSDQAAAGVGGAVGSLDATLTVKLGTFTGNTAFQLGGAIDTSGPSNPTLTVTSSNFKNNATLDSTNTNGYGGAICDSGGDGSIFNLTGSTFTNNTAAANGGAVLSFGGTGSTLTVANDTFTGNTADLGSGGGIASADDTLNLTGSAFSNNTVIGTVTPTLAGSGGALSSQATTLTVTNDTFTGNTSPSDGGAIYFNGGTGTITASNFTSDTSSAGFGGAISSNSTQLTLSKCSLSANGANGQGGAIYSTDGTFNLYNSTVASNSAGDAGGGVSFTGSGSASIANDTFFGNSAAGQGTVPLGGGAIYLNTPGLVTITDSTMDANTAQALLGGGIQADLAGGTVTLDGNIVALNTVTGSPSTYNDLAGNFATGSADNLIGDGSNQTGLTNGTNGNLVGSDATIIDPLLGALANNGGLTQTQKPAAGSQAIGSSADFPVSDPSGHDVTAVDQTGLDPRPQKQGYDIGAYQTGRVAGPSVSLGNVSVHVPATGAISVGIPITLSATAQSAIKLTYYTHGLTANAAAGDYNGVTSNTITIPAGTKAGIYTKYLTITGVKFVSSAKNANPYPRKFQVGLASSTNSTIAGWTSVVTLSAPLPTVQLQTPAPVKVPAKGTTTVRIPVVLSAPAKSEIILTYRTIAGTAANQFGDYRGVSSGTVTLPQNTPAGTYFITIYNVKYVGISSSTPNHYPKKFQIELESATNATVVGGTEIVTVTLESP